MKTGDLDPAAGPSGRYLNSRMADSGDSPPPNRPSRGSGSLTVHLADELDVYFNEVAHGRPVGFVASPKWKPRTDVYETDEELIVHMDIAGMRAEDFNVELDESILKISGERATNGITITREWKTLNYEFDVRGLEDVELICELRGAQGRGEFDARSLRLVRKGPALTPLTPASLRLVQ